MLHALCGQVGWDRKHLGAGAGAGTGGRAPGSPRHTTTTAASAAGAASWAASGLDTLPPEVRSGVAALLAHRQALASMGVNVGVTPGPVAAASAGAGGAGGAVHGAPTTAQVVAATGDPLANELVRQVLR